MNTNLSVSASLPDAFRARPVRAPSNIATGVAGAGGTADVPVSTTPAGSHKPLEPDSGPRARTRVSDGAPRSPVARPQAERTHHAERMPDVSRRGQRAAELYALNAGVPADAAVRVEGVDVYA